MSDINFNLENENEELNVEITNNSNEVKIDVDNISKETVNFNLVDDNIELQLELVDDENGLEFSMTDYDDTEVKELISNMDTKVDELSSHVDNQVEIINNNIENLESKKADKTQINTIQGEINDLTSQVEVNTTQISQNKADIETLDGRVDRIPIVKKTSQLINDSGFITNEYHDPTKQDRLQSGINIKTINNKSLLGGGNLVIEGVNNYPDLNNLPSINGIVLKGNKTSANLGLQPAGDYALRSQIPDVSQFITKDVNNLTNYYKKSETYTRTQVNNLVNDKQNKIDSSHKLDSDLVDDTNQTNKFVTVQEKTTWNNKSDFSGSYNDLTDKPTIPSKTSELTNDSGFIDNTVDDLTNYTLTSNLATVATSGSYNDLSNKPTIPDELADLAGDSTHRTVTDAQITLWDNKSNFSGAYSDLTSKPQYTVGKTTFDNTTRAISVSTENITIDGTNNLDYYHILNFTPVDLTPYNTSTRTNMLHPETQLPDGNYYVTGAGRIWFSSESYSCIPGEIIYKHNNEMVVVGMYGCVYYAYDTTDEEWRGGFFTTYQDVTDMLDERIIWVKINSGSFVVANKDNGYYLFNYSSASGTTRRININVGGTNRAYYPYNGTILIKNDKYVVILGRENYIFEYDSTNQYYKQPLDIVTALSNIDNKYDKTGGEISGDVKIDGDLTLDIDDPDYDSGITITKALDTNLGTTMTLTGYANAEGSLSNYKPIIRNVGTPNSSYDVANKKYVDDNVVVPTYHLVFLNPDGTIDTYASTINYNTIKNNLTDPKEKDYLDVLWNTTRFYAEVVEITDVNTGDLKFIGEVEYQGIQRYIVFTLTPSNVLTTTNIITFESVSNKVSSIVSNSTSVDKYPNTKAVFDEFQRKPVIVWETDSNFLNAIQADITENPAWQLTGLDMTPFKRIKIYSKAGKGRTTAGATGGMILEMSLDDRAGFADYGGNFVGSVLVQKPNDANRYASLTCAVSADKTKFVVLRQTSLYGTAATTNNDIGADVFKIEGYYD